MTARCVDFYLGLCKPDALNVHTIHAETEGMGQLESFTALIRALKERGAKFVQLGEVASRLNRAELPVCEVVRTTLAGQGGMDFGARSRCVTDAVRIARNRAGGLCYIPGTTIQLAGDFRRCPHKVILPTVHVR